MGTWLTLAARVFASVPAATQKHAILLTDGDQPARDAGGS